MTTISSCQIRQRFKNGKNQDREKIPSNLLPTDGRKTKHQVDSKSVPGMTLNCPSRHPHHDEVQMIDVALTFHGSSQWASS